MIQFNLNSDEPLKMSVKEAVLIKGDDGKSAYQIALDNGFEGSESEWLESLHGENGKTPVKGTDYFDGTSCTHKWDGTTLTVTSASGTSSANLKGDAGRDAFPITDTKTDTIVTLKDSANTTLLDFTVNDDIPVQSVKIIGKNIFHRDYVRTSTHLGVTFSWDEVNQEITMNGTLSGSGDLKLVDPLKLDWVAGEQYTVTVTPVGGSAILNATVAGTNFGWGIFQNNASKYIRGQLHFLDINAPYSFTNKAFALDENKHLIFYFQCWKPGTVFDNFRVKVQIERGTQSTDWEPYREESVAIDNVKSYVLPKGYNNLVPVPSANISVGYVVDTKLYIDNKIAELANAK